MVKYRQKPDVVFSALGNPVRRQMVELLARQTELSVTDIARPFHLSLPGALKHVRVLESASLVLCEKKGRVQQCSLRKEALKPVADWIRVQGAFWESSFQRLDAVINRKHTKYERRNTHH